MHEFLHTLGFYHQHSSADRNKFVTIIEKNIKPGEELQFEKYSNEDVTNFGYDYDYKSIMHYAPKDFSDNGEDVIIPLFDGAEDMGQRKGLTNSDYGKINKMYNCPNSLF